MDAANDFLFGGSIPSAKFDTPGDYIVGIIEDTKVTQQTDFRTQKPLTWDNGDPKMQLVVTLKDTGQRDPANPNDDGRRKVYVKGSSLTDGLRNAIRAAGSQGIENGGKLTVQYTGDGVPSERGLNPPKLYAVGYEPPSTQFLGLGQPTAVGGQQPQQGYVQQQQIPVAQPQQQQIPVPQPQLVGAGAPVIPAAQIPGIGQLIPQVAAPAVEQSATPAAPALTPEVQAALAALSPEQRAALGL